MALPAPAAGPVVVTGASSGIGTALARGLAERGYDLVLVARRQDRLEALAVELRALGVTATVRPCDLADADARAALAVELAETTVAGLCNCAGFGTSGKFHTLPLDRELEQVAVDLVAVVELTGAVLPGMVRRGSGAVLNVASIAGFQPMPSMATYSASKSFVITHSAAVHEELRGTGVSVSALCPGPVPTEWADVSDAHALDIPAIQQTPEAVASAGIAAMTGGRREVVPGRLTALVSMFGRSVPRSVLLPAVSTGLRLARTRSSH